MKKSILLIATICLAFAAQAQLKSYKVMKVHKGDEVTHTIKLSDIDSLSFEEQGRPVNIEEISVGDWSESGNNFISKAPRGVISGDNFFFTAGDQVLVAGMTLEDYDAWRDDKAIWNTFTFDGAYWTQDEPQGNYQGIYVQDDMMIVEIRSYGGFAVDKSYNDQSTEERYVAADELKASIMASPPIGKISTKDYKQYTATLEHMNADFVLKVYDGAEEADILGENAVLEVIVDKDGSYSGTDIEIYKAWNTGKSTDDKGTFSTFRLMLPDGCSIVDGELSNVNAATSGLTADIYFRAPDGQPSNEIDLERGKRYTTEYTYNSTSSAEAVMLK